MTVAETGSMLEITLALVAPMRRMPWIKKLYASTVPRIIMPPRAPKSSRLARGFISHGRNTGGSKPAEQHSPAEHGGHVMSLTRGTGISE